jgi:hypothetical protein
VRAISKIVIAWSDDAKTWYWSGQAHRSRSAPRSGGWHDRILAKIFEILVLKRLEFSGLEAIYRPGKWQAFTV